MNKIKNRTLVDSFNNAFNGIFHTIKSESNMRYHIIIAMVVLFYSLFSDLTKIELVVILITISLVIICELFNTALEVLVNVMIKVYHPKAKIIKDVGAGAVLLSAFNAMIVGYFIFFDRVSSGLASVIERIRLYPVNIIGLALVINIISVLVIKTFFKKGTPFRGGMPSGHAAVAFSITTGIAVWIQNVNIVILCLVLCFLVVQSRVEAKIHSVYEVFTGAVLGFLFTLFIFHVLHL